MLVAFSDAQLIPVNLPHDGVKSLGWRHSTYRLWCYREDDMSGKISSVLFFITNINNYVQCFNYRSVMYTGEKKCHFRNTI